MKKTSFAIPRVEMHPWDRWLEIASAVLMSLATISSAWCAYQSARWGGEQSFYLSEAASLGRESARVSVQAGQMEILDGAMFMQFAHAMSQDNKELAEFYRQRFRPDMKKALDAWLALKPLENADAPPTPFDMSEYRIAERDQAEELSARVFEVVEKAKNANRISDNFILFTVIFASVLFFAGVATKFQSRRLKVVVVAIGYIVYLSGAGWLSTLPMH